MFVDIEEWKTNLMRMFVDIMYRITERLGSVGVGFRGSWQH